MSGLRRSLGLLDATMVNVGVIVGSAVFLTASDVARALPHPLLQLGMWVVAAVFSLAGALTIAELGASFPQAGGLCVYLREAFGPLWGFLYGWALLVVIQTASIAAVAVFVLRRRLDLERPYRVWGYPLVPAAFVAFAALLLAATVASDPGDAALGGGLLLTGVPAYLFFRNRARSAAPATHPPT